MLVSAKDMLVKAKEGHYAVGQFNINNLEWTKSILLTAEELKSPVILGVSEGAGKYMTGFETVAAMVKAMDKSLGITVPVALHLDHGTFEGAKKCIELGYTSVMFDGSHYDIDENIEKSKEEILHQLDEICSGNVTDEEIQSALLSLDNALTQIGDTPASYSGWYFERFCDGRIKTPQEQFEDYSNVTKERIIEAAK
ncbi:MAG: class II fructose-bisphosphate aldolase, partial [Bacteroidales bacterium]|nr:class II fructose-bisphosphate aldolase [Bacteroidales bacterium]